MTGLRGSREAQREKGKGGGESWITHFGAWVDDSDIC